MKRKVLAIVLCLSMLFSSQAFAMSIPKEHNTSKQVQEFSAEAEQAAESPADLSSSKADPSKEPSSEENSSEESSSVENSSEESSSQESSSVESSSEESSSQESSSVESSSEESSSQESSSVESSSEESSSQESSSEEDNKKDYTIFSDGKGTNFILIDKNHVPAEKGENAVGAAVYNSTSTDTSYTIPSEVTDPATGKTWPVTAVYEQALADHASLQQVQIPGSVQVIGAAAFKDCRNLKTIYLSGSPEIASNAFDGVEATAYCPLSWEKFPASDAFGGKITWTVSIPKLSNLKAASASYNSAKISWSKISSTDGYIVYRKDNGSWKRLSVTEASSYTDKKLVCGQSYTYTVRAYKNVNGKDVKGDYNKKGVTAKILPATTKLGEATSSGNSIQITWSKVSGASGYRVYRLNPETGKWKGIKNVSNSVTSYTDKGLTAGQYTYTVRAYRTVSGEKIFGGYNKKGISANIVPATPKMLNASGSPKNITVQWGTIADADGYRVYRKSGSGSWQKLKDIANGTVSSYKDKTAVEGTYVYTVRAYVKANDKTIWGGYQKKGISVTIPSQPKLVSAVASKSKKQSIITVKWESVPQADGYRIYRKVNDGGWKLLTTQSGNTLSVVDKKVTSGTIYTYTVRAYTNAGNKQVLSNYDKKGVKAVGYMEAPEMLLTASWYDDNSAMADLLLLWEHVENADGYIIYYKEAGQSSWARLDKINDEEVYDEESDLCLGYLGEVDMRTEYLFTVRPYKIVDGKEVKGAYNKKGVSTKDAIDLEEILEEE